MQLILTVTIVVAIIIVIIILVERHEEKEEQSRRDQDGTKSPVPRSINRRDRSSRRNWRSRRSTRTGD